MTAQKNRMRVWPWRRFPRERAMHVVQVNYAWDPKLVEPEQLLDRYTTLTGWSRGLTAAGARTSVVQRFSRDARIVRDGVEYVFRDARRLNAEVERLAGDVVHVNGLVFPIETWMLARKVAPRAAIVLQDHASGDPARSGLLEPLRHGVRRRALAVADAFLFAAAEQADAWRNAGLIRARQPVFAVMEAAAGLSPIDPGRARRESGMSGAPALLWVGRLNPNKDPLTVLDGFERGLRLLPSATLTMVYEGGELVDAVRRRIASSAALAGRVRMVGAVPHARLAAFYSGADLFVLGSHQEGSGYALLEACACGAVPLVTAIPSFRKITNDGALGAIWPPGDQEAFTRSLIDLANRDLKALSACAIAHTRASFSWPAIGREAVAAYGEVLRSRAARA